MTIIGGLTVLSVPRRRLRRRKRQHRPFPVAQTCRVWARCRFSFSLSSPGSGGRCNCVAAISCPGSRGRCPRFNCAAIAWASLHISFTVLPSASPTSLASHIVGVLFPRGRRSFLNLMRYISSSRPLSLSPYSPMPRAPPKPDVTLISICPPPLALQSPHGPAARQGPPSRLPPLAPPLSGLRHHLHLGAGLTRYCSTRCRVKAHRTAR